MLAKLYIKNFAIIDELEIDFSAGMITVTGETGAGKSIILGALKLVLGERADLKSIKNQEQKCIIEATFILNDQLKSLFEENELEYEKETILRREISSQGKSRSFINDVPTTLNILQLISNQLIDIHSQFETEQLLNSNYQMKLLDGFCKNQTEIANFREVYKRYKESISQLSQCKELLEQGNQESDYQKFLFDELQQAQLDSLHFPELESQLKEMENAEQIGESYAEILQLFSDENIGVENNLNLIINKIQRISSVSAQASQFLQRIESLTIEVKDIINEIEKATEQIEFEPQQLEQLKGKHNLILNLFTKHRVNSINELIEIRNSLKINSENNLDLEENIQKLEQEIQQIQNELERKSIKIRQNREENIPKIQQNLLQLFNRLGLENADLKFQLTDNQKYNNNGKDNLQILFSANKGIALQPIEKAISGGERSRIMLAIKKLMAENEELPTLILDEIDTGVSGRIANEIGNLMQEMAHKMQLIVITHLPQIAAKANTHFKVIKLHNNETTQTIMQILSENERITEIAHLLSGATITDAALQQAEELLK